MALFVRAEEPRHSPETRGGGGPSRGPLLERRLSQEAGLRTVHFLVMLPKGHPAKMEDKGPLFKLYKEKTPAINMGYNPNHFDGLGQEIRVEDGCR